LRSGKERGGEKNGGTKNIPEILAFLVSDALKGAILR